MSNGKMAIEHLTKHLKEDKKEHLGAISDDVKLKGQIKKDLKGSYSDESDLAKSFRKVRGKARDGKGGAYC